MSMLVLFKEGKSTLTVQCNKGKNLYSLFGSEFIQSCCFRPFSMSDVHMYWRKVKLSNTHKVPDTQIFFLKSAN